MFAIEFKEKKYDSIEEHLEKIAKHAKEALECIEYQKSEYKHDSDSKHDSNSSDNHEINYSRY